MAQINFTGNLGGEPKMDFKQSGNACLAFNVADTKGKKDRDGNWDKASEQTQWFRCTLWGPDAEYYVDRLRKGARVTVFGDFMAREYVDRDGVNRTSMDVTVRGLSVINKRTNDTGSSQGANDWSATQPGSSTQASTDPWAAPNSTEPPW